MAVPYKPDGYYNVTPYILVEQIKEMLAFAEASFDAVVIEDIPDHAEIRIGDSIMMIGRAHKNRPPMPATFYIYVEDCSKTYEKAIAAGGVSLMPPEDMYYGDRNAGVKDPFGNIWWIATHIEDVSPEELQKRADEYIRYKK